MTPPAQRPGCQIGDRSRESLARGLRATLSEQHRQASGQPAAGGLEVRQLSYRYPTGQLALDGMTFSLSHGERVALVGPSGAGKSTLLLHLNGLLPAILPKGPAEPAVYVAGVPVVPAQLSLIRRQVGLLFQDPDDQLFCPTVQDDVAFGPLNAGLGLDEVRRRVVQSLSAVGLPDAGPRNPAQLSVGERKRVCLAGLLACEPSVLVLDEPTASLDPRARRQLQGILRNFPGLQLIATHDLDFVLDLCTRVLVIDAGRLQADGPPERILSDPLLMDRHGLEVPWRLRPNSLSR